MAASQPANFNLQEFTDAGLLLVGGRLYTYAYGTTTQKTAYTDPAGTVPHTYTSDGAGGQYIALNARGELPAPLYLASGSYDLALKRADGSSVWTRKADGVENSSNSLAAQLAASSGSSLIGGGNQVVSSIAGLRALLKTSASKNAFVTGYYAAGDGGGGAYYYDSSDTTSSDNGGTIIVATDGGRWKLADTKTVTLEQFGGGGSRSTTENATAANLACKWCFENGSTLRLKATTYSGARIEVHGSFDVEGNGATIDFLGVGYTIIAGTGSGTGAVPTAWPSDGAIYNSAAYVPTMYSIGAPVAIGDDSITLGSVSGLAAGDIIFIAGNPSSASSVGNYIPASCEYAQILSIVGNVVTLNGKARNTYTTAGAVFKTPGLARGCRISNLRLKSTGSEAYQLTIRSVLNVVIDGVEFAGRDTLGSATFDEGLVLRNFRTSGAGGNWSFARATISAILDGLLFQYRSGMTADTNGVFIEESCYDISIRSVRGYGASFSVRQMDMTGAVIKRAITVIDSTFDTLNAPGGATSPMQCGTAAGVDIEFVNCTLAGAVSTPNAGTYPGVTGTALMWITGNQSTDKVKFSACHIKASTSGASFKKGSGAQGSVLFDDVCTYETVDEPITDYTPRGAWSDMTSTLLNGYTVAASSVAQYRYSAKQIYMRGRLNLNGAAAGSTFFTMAAGLRPLTEARSVVATDTAGVFATIRINTSGNVFYVGSNGTPTYIQLDQVSFPVDN